MANAIGLSRVLTNAAQTDSEAGVIERALELDFFRSVSRGMSFESDLRSNACSGKNLQDGWLSSKTCMQPTARAVI
jgi:hypothetical protein